MPELAGNNNDIGIKAVGIFGGSFNPIHTGHVRLARQILHKTGLDEVWFMVSPLNPLKKSSTDLLDDRLRLLMAQKALESEKGLVACDYEFHLPKPSYTWSTLQHLITDYPSCRFSLIIGADNWLVFNRWVKPDYILAHCDMIVYPRKGYPVDDSSLPANVKIVNTELYPISSTEIRQKVKEGTSIEGLVPDNIVPLVEQYYK